jgi:hypothetical protein
MLRRIVALAGVTMMVLAVAVPVAADPPPESGVVVRIVDTEGFGVFPDVTNGYWVFSNVTRDDFCTWFYDMGGVPVPENQSPDHVQLVFASDALVVSVHAGGPTALHAFAEPDPFANPCDGSEPDAALTGDVKVRVNDNDGPNEGKRANTFGDRGQGTLYDADGGAYRYSWVFRALWAPDDNAGDDTAELKVVTDKFNLHPVGR